MDDLLQEKDFQDRERGAQWLKRCGPWILFVVQQSGQYLRIDDADHVRTRHRGMHFGICNPRLWRRTKIVLTDVALSVATS